VDWEALFGLLSTAHLAPLLYYRIKGLDRFDAVPSRTGELLHESFRANQIRTHLYRQELDKLSERLADRGLEGVLLKGALSLFLEIYEHPAIRVMQDLDLFFSGSDRDALRGILIPLGYGLIESGLRHDIYLNRKKDIRMELHYHLFEAYLSRRDAEKLNRRCWDRRGPITGGPHALSMLSPPDLIFFHVYHATVHHTGWVYESLYTLGEFIALVRFFRIDGTDELLKESAAVGLTPFFLLFLYLLQVKTGWRGNSPVPISGRLKKAFHRYLIRETLSPAWHGLHIRRLILGGFGGGFGACLRRLRQMIVLDKGTGRETLRRVCHTLRRCGGAR